MRLRFHSLMLLLVGLVSAGSAEERTLQVTPSARVEPGKVHLRWTAQAWEAGVTGMEVRRRVENGDWEPVNGGVIRPMVDPARDWFAIDPHPRAQARLKSKTDEWIKKGILQRETAEVFTDRLATYGATEWTSLSGQINNSLDMACVLGFALVDRDFPQPGTVTYALHAVRGESIDPGPAATLRVQVESVQPEWMRLFAAVDGETLKLKWQVRDYWPQQVVGFVVQRRKEPGAPWRTLSPGPMYPGVLTDRSWAHQGLEGEAATKIQAKVDQLQQEGTLKAASREDTLERLHGAQLSELTSINLLTLADFDRSLALGFACITPYVAPEELGLFAVAADGSVDPEPISVCRAQPVQHNPFDRSFSFSVRKATRGTAARWSIPESQFRDRALVGYHVYRARPGAQMNFERLSLTPIVSLDEAQERRSWHFIDGKADSEQTWIYAVAAVDHFGREFPQRKTTYTPALTPHERFAKAGDVTIARAAMSEQGQGIDIGWDFNPVGEAYIHGFVVERAKLPDETFEAISRVLPRDRRTHVDGDALDMGEVYAYRVGLVGESGVFRRSTRKAVLALHAVLPPPPAQLTAQHAEKNGAAQVHLHWQPPADSVDEVLGYVVFADLVVPGQLVRQGSVPLIDQEHYIFPLGAQRGRTFTFGVAAKSKLNVVGEMAKVTCYVPANNLPTVSRVEVAKVEQGRRARLTWEYARHDDLNGFEIYQNDQLVASSNQLAAHLRSWESGVLAPNTLYEFRVIARSDRLGASKHSRPVEHFYIKKSEK